MYVYLIGAFQAKGGVVAAVKIGITNNLERRLKEIQTGQFHEVRLIAAWAVKSRLHALGVESDMHHILRRDQVRGEWFKSRDVDTIVKRISGKAGQPPAYLLDWASEQREAKERAEFTQAERRLDRQLLREQRHLRVN